MMSAFNYDLTTNLLLLSFNTLCFKICLFDVRIASPFKPKRSESFVFRAQAGRAHSTASLPNNRHQISIQIPSISYLCHLHFAITNDEKALDKVMLLPNERLTLLNVFNANTLQLIRKVFVQKL